MPPSRQPSATTDEATLSTAELKRRYAEARPPFGIFWEQRVPGHAQLWTTHVSRPAGAVLAFGASRLRLTPNLVSALALLVTSFGALLYFLLPINLVSAIALVVVFQLGYALDCADGQLARATGRTSAFGEWLDVMLDMVSAVTIPAAMAAFAILRIQTSQPLWFVLAGMALVYSRPLSLLTSTMKRMGGERMRGGVAWYRLVYRLVSETPFFLVVIVLVRFSEPALLATMAGYAALFIAHSFYLARQLGATPNGARTT